MFDSGCGKNCVPAYNMKKKPKYSVCGRILSSFVYIMAFLNLLLYNNIHCFNDSKVITRFFCLFLFFFILQRGVIVSEPAIQVRRKGKSTQVWTIEKLENKLIDMRDLYQEWKEKVPEVKATKCKGDLVMLIAENIMI